MIPSDDLLLIRNWFDIVRESQQNTSLSDVQKIAYLYNRVMPQKIVIPNQNYPLITFLNSISGNAHKDNPIQSFYDIFLYDSSRYSLIVEVYSLTKQNTWNNYLVFEKILNKVKIIPKIIVESFILPLNLSYSKCYFENITNETICSDINNFLLFFIKNNPGISIKIYENRNFRSLKEIPGCSRKFFSIAFQCPQPIIITDSMVKQIRSQEIMTIKNKIGTKDYHTCIFLSELSKSKEHFTVDSLINYLKNQNLDAFLYCDKLKKNVDKKMNINNWMKQKRKVAYFIENNLQQLTKLYDLPKLEEIILNLLFDDENEMMLQIETTMNLRIV